MRLLLDTHALLWAVADDPALGAAARTCMVDAEEAYVSVASRWEITIKVSIGKLAPVEGLGDAYLRHGLDRLDIDDAHLLDLQQLPWHHRDPFDRMLISQARVEALTVVTADRHFGAYDVAVVDARS